ncbi:MAG: hypothetical protein ACYSPI_05265, partial [Planctomycetota bacterium]
MQQKKIASVMLWVLLLCGSSVIFAKGMPDQVQDKLRVAQYKLQDLDLPEQANIPDFLNIAVQFNGEVKELALEKRSVRSEDFRVLIQGSDGRSTEIDPGPVRTYWGTVVGERDSVVAATLTDAGLEAQVFNCEDAGWSVYPGQGIDKSFRRTQHVIFDNADQAPQGNPDAPDVPDMLNGMPVAGYNGSAAISAPTALFTAGTASYAGYGCDVWQAEAGVDFEYRYYNEFAGGSSAVCQERAETTTNFMNGVYIQNLMVSYTLKTVVVRTSSAACPYYSSGDKLNAMRAEWNANYPNHDIAALVCYGSGAIGGGVAWVSSIANGNHY